MFVFQFTETLNAILNMDDNIGYCFEIFKGPTPNFLRENNKQGRLLTSQSSTVLPVAHILLSQYADTSNLSRCADFSFTRMKWRYVIARRSGLYRCQAFCSASRSVMTSRVDGNPEGRFQERALTMILRGSYSAWSSKLCPTDWTSFNAELRQLSQQRVMAAAMASRQGHDISPSLSRLV